MSDWNKVLVKSMTLANHMTTATPQNDVHEEYNNFGWPDCV